MKLRWHKSEKVSLMAVYCRLQSYVAVVYSVCFRKRIQKYFIAYLSLINHHHHQLYNISFLSILYNNKTFLRTEEKQVRFVLTLNITVQPYLYPLMIIVWKHNTVTAICLTLIVWPRQTRACVYINSLPREKNKCFISEHMQILNFHQIV